MTGKSVGRVHLLVLRGGGGDHPEFVVKLVSEIAVDQQTRTGDQTFEGNPNSKHPPVPAVQPRRYLVPFGPIMPNHLNMSKIQILNETNFI